MIRSVNQELKIIQRLLRCVLLCGMISFVFTQTFLLNTLSVSSIPQDIYVDAEGAALIDVQSGRILWSKAGDKRLRIASLTKIMTAIIAIEHGDLSDMITVSAQAYAKEGSSIYLQLGQQMSLHHMLYGMMLRSGNDAATAIAEHIGGSIEGFSILMNEKAQLLGMYDSHFGNPTGLDDVKDHFSTAHDMALLTAYALQNPVFQEIVKTKHKKAPNPNADWEYNWKNKNKMLYLFEGSDGVKTGYTELAKRCLISSATLQGQQLAVVTLNDRHDWIDHCKILEYGFRYFPQTAIPVHSALIDLEKWQVPATFLYPLTEEEKKQVTQQVKWFARESMAYRLGYYGYIEIHWRGKSIGVLPIYPIHENMRK
jgi:D-alanyl-D-alanine carboxypeptidase (penicillin-binding protein 5/6)